MVLTGLTFRLTCLTAAALFAALTVVQIRALPATTPTTHRAGSMLTDWRHVLANRRFLAFSLAMIGSYVLSFQLYLALPLHARHIAPTETAGTVAVCVLFGVSGAIAILGQIRITAACRRRWHPPTCIVLGLGLMALAFIMPLLAAAVGLDSPAQSPTALALGLAPLGVCTALLALGTAIVFPFEMDTIVSLSDHQLVATHYGLYNTLCGIGIALGNLGTGAALDLARAHHLTWLPWLTLVITGLACALAVRFLARTGRLTPETQPAAPAPAS
jgi:hypothetical protein